MVAESFDSKKNPGEKKDRILPNVRKIFNIKIIISKKILKTKCVSKLT